MILLRVAAFVSACLGIFCGIFIMGVAFKIDSATSTLTLLAFVLFLRWAWKRARQQEIAAATAYVLAVDRKRLQMEQQPKRTRRHLSLYEDKPGLPSSLD